MKSKRAKYIITTIKSDTLTMGALALTLATLSPNLKGISQICPCIFFCIVFALTHLAIHDFDSVGDLFVLYAIEKVRKHDREYDAS